MSKKILACITFSVGASAMYQQSQSMYNQSDINFTGQICPKRQKPELRPRTCITTDLGGEKLTIRKHRNEITTTNIDKKWYLVTERFDDGTFEEYEYPVSKEPCESKEPNWQSDKIDYNEQINQQDDYPRKKEVMKTEVTTSNKPVGESWKVIRNFQNETLYEEEIRNSFVQADEWDSCDEIEEIPAKGNCDQTLQGACQTTTACDQGQNLAQDQSACDQNLSQNQSGSEIQGDTLEKKTNKRAKKEPKVSKYGNL